MEHLAVSMFRFENQEWIQALSDTELSWSSLFDLLEHHSTSIEAIFAMVHDMVLNVPIHPFLPDAFRFWKRRVHVHVLSQAVWSAFLSFQFIGDSASILERRNIQWTGDHQIELAHELLWNDLQKWLS
jgi:hypothetical protein